MHARSPAKAFHCYYCRYKNQNVTHFFPDHWLALFYDQKKSLHPLPAESHAAARSMKLLAKIPKDAEATVVLVGKSVNALPSISSVSRTDG